MARQVQRSRKASTLPFTNGVVVVIVASFACSF